MWAISSGEESFSGRASTSYRSVSIQDGPSPFPVDVRELDGEERATWWHRAVDAYPDYANYQANTERVIPVFLATPRS